MKSPTEEAAATLTGEGGTFELQVVAPTADVARARDEWLTTRVRVRDEAGRQLEQEKEAIMLYELARWVDQIDRFLNTPEFDAVVLEGIERDYEIELRRTDSELVRALVVVSPLMPDLRAAGICGDDAHPELPFEVEIRATRKALSSFRHELQQIVAGLTRL